MAAWWDRTVTVYNKVIVDKHITYVRHVLKDVFLGTSQMQSLVDGNIQTASAYVLRVPQNDKYLPPMQYATLMPAELSKHFTLCPGDIVICGDIAFDMRDTTGFRPSDALKKYIGFIVQSTADNTGADPKHYKAVGTSG